MPVENRDLPGSDNITVCASAVDREIVHSSRS